MDLHILRGEGLPDSNDIRQMLPWIDEPWYATPGGVSTATVIAQALAYIEWGEVHPRLVTHAKRLGVILPPPTMENWELRFRQGFKIMARAMGGSVTCYEDTWSDDPAFAADVMLDYVQLAGEDERETVTWDWENLRWVFGKVSQVIHHLTVLKGLEL
jgi:hypothetical protein